MAKLTGKVAIVTGSGQGVGRGIALALAKEGTKTVIVDLNPETAGLVAGEIRHLGGVALDIRCDVSSEQQVGEMITKAVNEFGTIDILVNNAQRVPPPRLLEAGDDAWWDAYFQTGPRGTWYCCKAAFPYLRSRGGKVINMCSKAGILGIYDVGYAACKEAIRGFTRCAAREWGKYKINVNAICPSAMTPAKAVFYGEFPGEAQKALEGRPIAREGDPELDIGRAVVFLASTDADFITGQTIIVSGGEIML